LAFSEAVVLLIGDELLEGRVSDLNLAAVAGALADRGIGVTRALILPDSRGAIVEAVRGAIAPGRVIVTTGGLGPTDDDLTVPAVAEAFGLELCVSDEAEAHIRSWYSSAGRAGPPPSALRQALIPSGARAVANPAGVAPGIVLPAGSCTTVCLPGVPREVQALLQPCLDDAGVRGQAAPGAAVLRTWGMPENALFDMLSGSSVCAPAQIAFLARPGLVDVKLRGPGAAPAADRIAGLLGEAVYARDWTSLEAVVGRQLEAGNATLSVAESCTGGLLGARITSVPGSSGWFAGGMIAYSNYLKRKLLQVPGEVIVTSGAVSEAVALAMAAGVRRLSGSDFALSVTGVAGPGGGTEDKPVGTVWIALEGPGSSEAREWRFGGTRQAVREASSACAIGMLSGALRRGRP